MGSLQVVQKVAESGSMECPHRKLVAKGAVVHCQLVNFGSQLKDDPCQSCQSEWTNGPPTLESLTPTLNAMIGKFQGKPIPRAKLRPPSMIERVKSFAYAFANHIASGGKTLPPEEAKARMDICMDCQYRGSLMGAKVCNLCGCSLAIKTTWSEQSCPVKKWPGDSERPPCGTPCGGQSSNRDGDGGTTSLETQ